MINNRILLKSLNGYFTVQGANIITNECLITKWFVLLTRCWPNPSHSWLVWWCQPWLWVKSWKHQMVSYLLRDRGNKRSSFDEGRVLSRSYCIKTLDMKAGVWVNLNNFPIDFEEKCKNLKETINTCKKKKTVNSCWRIIRAFNGKDGRCLTKYLLSHASLVT